MGNKGQSAERLGHNVSILYFTLCAMPYALSQNNSEAIPFEQVRKNSEDNVFVDHRSFFDDGRGFVAVFNRHDAFDSDMAFKIDIAFDAKGFTIH